jgi:hypothetical protein
MTSRNKHIASSKTKKEHVGGGDKSSPLFQNAATRAGSGCCCCGYWVRVERGAGHVRLRSREEGRGFYSKVLGVGCDLGMGVYWYREAEATVIYSGPRPPGPARRASAQLPQLPSPNSISFFRPRVRLELRKGHGCSG